MKALFLTLLFSISVLAQPFASPLILTDGATEISRWSYSACASNSLLHSLNFGRNINTGNTGCNNLIVGNYETTSSLITTGLNNTLIGNSSGLALTTGAANTYLGQSAGGGNRTGWYNVAIGQATGAWNYFGQRNIYIGHRAGSQQSAFGEFTADDNVFIGFEAGYQNQAGVRNTFVGNNAGRSSGSFDSVFIGYNAGRFESGDNRFEVANSNGVLLTGVFNTDINEQSLRVRGNLILADLAEPYKSCTKGTIAYSKSRIFICVEDNVWKSVIVM